MEYRQVEALLEKYLNAETSIQEEQSLRRFFLEEEVPHQLMEYQPLFQFFSQERNEKLQSPASPKRSYYRVLSMAAAVIVIALGTFGIYQSEQNRKEAQLAEAREAYKEVRMALELVSENMDKGTQKLAYIHQFDVAKRKIIKN